ncbi:hypothetical protein [Thiohalocapsa sp.]|nr:hypothetical protein [Thiohalocapsa sp.]
MTTSTGIGLRVVHPSVVPVPGVAWLLTTGLIGVAIARRPSRR